MSAANMTRKQAEAAIRVILASLSDRQLPTPTIEKRDGQTIAWFGGTGHHLGTAKRDGVREPDVHRSSGLLSLFEGEAVARLDAKHLSHEEA